MVINDWYRKSLSFLPTHRMLLLRAILVMITLALALLSALASSSARRNGEIGASAWLAILSLVLAALAGWGSIPQLLRSSRLFQVLSTIHFRINQAGTLFLGFVLLISMAAMNSGNNLLFLLLAIFLSIILASGIYSRVNLRGIDVSVYLPDMIYAQSDTELRIVFKNRKLLWSSFGLLLEGFQKWKRVTEEDRMENSGRKWNRWPRSGKWKCGIVWRYQVFLPLLPAGKNISLVLKVCFLHRGRYQPERFYLATSFPFGFFKKGIQSVSFPSILIFPSISGEDRLRDLWFSAEGYQSSSRKGLGGHFHSHRNYLSGDGVRNMDWKASAKAGTLLLKELSMEEQLRIHLILDTCIPEGVEEDRDALFEEMVSDAAGMIRSLLLRGAAVGLSVHGKTSLPKKDHPDFSPLMEQLAIVEREQSTEWSGSEAQTRSIALSIAQDSEVVLLTARKDMTFETYPYHWKVEYPSNRSRQGNR